MRFYNRETELALLNEIEKRSANTAQMTFVVGRRRIGKTCLLKKAYPQALYFFVARKNEALLCAEFLEEIKQKLQIPIYGEFHSFKSVFGLLMDVSKTHSFTLIIDEFQEFQSVNPSVFSEMQNIWDSHQSESKINLLLCGSVYAMMSKIFENAKEPLFGRATNRIYLEAFDIQTLKDILSDYHPSYTSEDLLAFYTITGGVAKYVELLVQKEAFTFSNIMDEVLNEQSLFLDEGKHILVEEFGKDYGNYFSILSLIASGKTSRVEIESILEIQTGGFLERLENDLKLIKKIRPILAKPGSRTLKYTIEDNFLRFWFRFIYKHQSALEAKNFEYLKTVVMRDYQTFSGKTLENYFVEKLKLEKEYNVIGNYWERKNLNEIDIVAVNELKKIVLFAEVKRNKENINLSHLKQKSESLLPKFKNYQLVYKGFSMDNM